MTLDLIEGKYQDAINFLNIANFEAVAHSEYYSPKYILMASIYYLMQDTEKTELYYNSARTAFEAKIVEYPEDSRYYGSLGIAYAGLGQKEKAIEYGKKAVELMPISKDALRGVYRFGELAQIYAMVGEYELALEHLDSLLSKPGPLSVNMLQIDPTWKPLMDNPGFNQLIEKYSQN
jgi:tetratricopeptide (TPR) repeat protein